MRISKSSAGKWSLSISSLKQYSEEIEWLRSLPYTIRVPSHGCIVVHAGLVPGVSLEAQESEHMTKMRNLIYPSGIDPLNHQIDGAEAEALRPEVAEKARDGVAWAEVWRGPEHVYFGHDARRGLQRCSFATGLDTGCCYGRQLSAVVLPGKEMVQVQATAAHAPC
jgi:bis(5'-nucleosyl)-tetraphosphatase (symmetrical)